MFGLVRSVEPGGLHKEHPQRGVYRNCVHVLLHSHKVDTSQWLLSQRGGASESGQSRPLRQPLIRREELTKKIIPSPPHHPSKKLFFIENKFRSRYIHQASSLQSSEAGTLQSSSCTKFGGNPSFPVNGIKTLSENLFMRGVMKTDESTGQLQKSLIGFTE